MADMICAYLGLGSNLDQPREQIRRAIRLLAETAGITIIKNAGFYVSRPMGPQDQPNFVNTVVAVETVLSPLQLLMRCQQIEAAQGRLRKRHWGERTIDIDILLYADVCMDTGDLVLPHPGITQRDFVYLPLLSLNESIDIPGIGSLKESLQITDDKTSYGCRFDGNIE